MTRPEAQKASTELLLFNFQRSEQRETFEIFEKAKATRKRGCSSAGRAPALQAGGHGFEPHHLHQVRSAGQRRAGWRMLTLKVSPRG